MRMWYRMKFECRKCKLIFDAITWEDVEELQNKKCGRYGKHRILGVIEWKGLLNIHVLVIEKILKKQEIIIVCYVYLERSVSV